MGPVLTSQQQPNSGGKKLLSEEPRAALDLTGRLSGLAPSLSALPSFLGSRGLL